jgi:NhaP-type Na+/H+ or K+/H+ antiporter
VSGFNEQMERIGELAVMLVVCAMLPFAQLPAGTLALLALLFLVIRPVSVWLGLLGAPVSSDQRLMIAWFGIRGIGSVYYLMYAINHGLARTKSVVRRKKMDRAFDRGQLNGGPLAERLTAVTLATVVVSIVLHGISVRPMMHLYRRRQESQDV